MFLLISQDDFVEKNLNVVPKAIDEICQCINISKITNANISHNSRLDSKSVTFTLKMRTTELINKLNETVSIPIYRCI